MSDQLTIDNVAVRLGLTYAEGHHHVLHMGKMQTDELNRWKQVAKFILQYLPSRDGAIVFTPPVTPQTRDQMALWIARHFLARTELGEDYWQRTKKPFSRVADVVLAMGPQ